MDTLAGFAEPEDSQAHLVVRSRTVTEPARRTQRRGEASTSSDNAPLESEDEQSGWEEFDQLLGISESEYDAPAEPRRRSSDPEANLRDFDFEDIFQMLNSGDLTQEEFERLFGNAVDYAGFCEHHGSVQMQ